MVLTLSLPTINLACANVGGPKLPNALLENPKDSVGMPIAFASILPWQIACYGVAAALMLLLPKRAAADAPQ